MTGLQIRRLRSVGRFARSLVFFILDIVLFAGFGAAILLLAFAAARAARMGWGSP